MQNRQSLLLIATLLCAGMVNAQTTYLPLWAKESWLLDRMEIKAHTNVDLNLSTVKPYMRRAYVAVADSMAVQLQAGSNPYDLTATDQYNLYRFMANSSEYSRFAAADIPAWKSKRSLGKGFFETPGNAIEVNNEGFYLSINPAVALQQGWEKDNDQGVFFRSAGLTGRGLIGKRVGFQFLATGNSEMGPLPFREFVERTSAVPGAYRYSVQGADTSAFTYADIRASATVNVTKYINVQFGRDQQFIGNGYRSLMLSNFSAPHLFLKLNTRIWRLNYTNWFMELGNSPFPATNKQLPKKYASMHHLSVNATKWLTVGVFEGIIFGREKHYEFNYLQPMIFLRSMEQQNGSPDNANVGADIKANIGKRGQVYAQLMIDEFKKDELVGARRNWWGNKQAIQLGAKYIDAFGIANLDLQAEVNQIRPFMYQFRDTAGAYTHALQPLAHPMGGNLREVIGLLRYQPMNRLYIFGRVNYWKQGLDSAGFNFGSDPNVDYSNVSQGGTRPREAFFPMFAGKPAQGINAALHVSYELKENLFAEIGGMYRVFDAADKPKVTTVMLQAGIRWNMFRRDYDY